MVMTIVTDVMGRWWLVNQHFHKLTYIDTHSEATRYAFACVTTVYNHTISLSAVRCAIMRTIGY